MNRHRRSKTPCCIHLVFLVAAWFLPAALSSAGTSADVPSIPRLDPPSGERAGRLPPRFLEHLQTCYRLEHQCRNGDGEACRRLSKLGERMRSESGPLSLPSKKEREFSPSSTEKDHVFHRMWPTLQQPWYFHYPYGLAAGKDETVYIADQFNDRIVKLTSDGKFITSWGKCSDEDGDFCELMDVSIGKDGNIYAAAFLTPYIQIFDPNGRFISKWGGRGEGDGQFGCVRSIATDQQGDVYVVDQCNRRIQKFTSDGKFITKWGNKGDGEGQFLLPEGIAVDHEGHVYVSDSSRNCIQKFTSDGQFLLQWGAKGSAEGQLSSPMGMAVDGADNLYVADSFNHRIQSFSRDGRFLSAWGSFGHGHGELFLPVALSIGPNGILYVADQYHPVQKFRMNGRFVASWGSEGAAKGELSSPQGIVRGRSGNFYVADYFNDRVQEFSPEGRFIRKWGDEDSTGGRLSLPRGLAVDPEGNLYVVNDDEAGIVKRFTPNGQRLSAWGSTGSGNGKFMMPTGIAIDKEGKIYIVDTYNHRVQKFNASGQFIAKWGKHGSQDGAFDYPEYIAVDADGYVYVTDVGNARIEKFTSDGKFVTKWGSKDLYGVYFDPAGISVDSEGNIEVVNRACGFLEFDGCVLRFDPQGRFLGTWGVGGTSAGEMNGPICLAFGDNGRAYVTEETNNRVQAFDERTVGSGNKAIIVAGGGPYPGNNLWEATEASANFVYRTLGYQGFTKESIYYLTPDTTLDLDENGKPDDVAGDATKENLERALTLWARGSEHVVVYLVDHGGNRTFTLKGGEEVLQAQELAAWLNELAETLTGQILFVYDACHSGSFLTPLASLAGRGRIVITGASANESAYFVNHGSISFSNYFWTHIFNGLDIADAFRLARQAIHYTSPQQNPLLDADSDGKGNEKQDFDLAQTATIGNGTKQFGTGPAIESVSPEQVIHDTRALLYADGVSGSAEIARVWALIRPPDFTPDSAGSPIRGLPSLDLVQKGNDRTHYEASYVHFNASGTYQIAFYAMDRIGNISVPKLTTVSVDSPLTRKAILAAGGTLSDPLWPAIEKGMQSAYASLKFQGYAEEDIYLLSPVSLADVPHESVLPNLGNLKFALQTWAKRQTLDLALYMIGNGDTQGFKINPGQELSAPRLKEWLDSLQRSIAGPVTVIYDASLSGSFLPALIPEEGKKRIFIASTGQDAPACFASAGDISFSRFFWNQVANGANVREAVLQAKTAMRYTYPAQEAVLDDNANGIGNEKSDGELAGEITLGAGITLAGDAPVIGKVSPVQKLSSESAATFWAKNITSTAPLEKVWAVITPPDPLSGTPSDPVVALPVVRLQHLPNGVYRGTFKKFEAPGAYNIAIYAVDRQGNLSAPQCTQVIRLK